MSPDEFERQFARLLSEVRELKAKLAHVEQWQSQFNIAGANGNQNQWAVYIPDVPTPFPNPLVPQDGGGGTSYPWIGYSDNGDGTYDAWLGGPAATIIDLNIHAAGGELVYSDGGNTAQMDSAGFSVDGADGSTASMGAGQVQVADDSGGFATLTPDNLAMGSEGAIDIAVHGTFSPQEVTWFDTSGAGKTAKALMTEPSGNGVDLWLNVIKSHVQSEIRTALATGSGSINCAGSTVTITFSY